MTLVAVYYYAMSYIFQGGTRLVDNRLQEL